MAALSGFLHDRGARFRDDRGLAQGSRCERSDGARQRQAPACGWPLGRRRCAAVGPRRGSDGGGHPRHRSGHAGRRAVHPPRRLHLPAALWHARRPGRLAPQPPRGALAHLRVVVARRAAQHPPDRLTDLRDGLRGPRRRALEGAASDAAALALGSRGTAGPVGVRLPDLGPALLLAGDAHAIDRARCRCGVATAGRRTASHVAPGVDGRGGHALGAHLPAGGGRALPLGRCDAGPAAVARGVLVDRRLPRRLRRGVDPPQHTEPPGLRSLRPPDLGVAPTQPRARPARPPGQRCSVRAQPLGADAATVVARGGGYGCSGRRPDRPSRAATDAPASLRTGGGPRAQPGSDARDRRPDGDAGRALGLARGAASVRPAPRRFTTCSAGGTGRHRRAHRCRRDRLAPGHRRPPEDAGAVCRHRRGGRPTPCGRLRPGRRHLPGSRTAGRRPRRNDVRDHADDAAWRARGRATVVRSHGMRRARQGGREERGRGDRRDPGPPESPVSPEQASRFVVDLGNVRGVLVPSIPPWWR